MTLSSGKQFLSTPSARRATPRSVIPLSAGMYFYPRPPRGGRPEFLSAKEALDHDFYPRPPRGGRPVKCSKSRCFCEYFYPRPPRGGRRFVPACKSSRLAISIHALREEGDRPMRLPVSLSCISIHALREEGDAGIFQGVSHLVQISIHALREEGDNNARNVNTDGTLFLSTPSARRATSPRRRRKTSSFHFYPRPPRGGRRVLT